MLQRDIMMRQIQQVVQVLMQVLADVLKLKSQGRYEEAIQSIREAFGEVELSPRPVGELSAEELLELCRTQRGFAVELALSVADLLREEADLLLHQGKPEQARTSAAKAHALYEEARSTKGAALPMDIARRIADAEEIMSVGDSEQG